MGVVLPDLDARSLRERRERAVRAGFRLLPLLLGDGFLRSGLAEKVVLDRAEYITRRGGAVSWLVEGFTPGHTGRKKGRFEPA
ncbi:MAG: hypothetical protein M3341_01150, partial [Actinomycetota bacterium]|nr:hypothetical protein [Actinomycetota bacterium]